MVHFYFNLQYVLFEEEQSELRIDSGLHGMQFCPMFNNRGYCHNGHIHYQKVQMSLYTYTADLVHETGIELYKL